MYREVGNLSIRRGSNLIDAMSEMRLGVSFSVQNLQA